MLKPWDDGKEADTFFNAIEQIKLAESLGFEVELAIANGGLDANWLFQHGIPAVSLGCGQLNAHTVNEQLDIEQFQRACKIALRLATGTE